jgi:hypothetical protein
MPKREFGALPPTAAGLAAAQPTAKRSKNSSILIEEFDCSKISLGVPGGSVVLSGRNGDLYVPLGDTNGGKLTFSFSKLPDYNRCPFEAGPFAPRGTAPTPAAAKEKEDNAKENWSMQIDLTPERYDAWVKFEDYLKEKLFEHRSAMYPKHDKKKDGMSREMFEDKFSSIVRPAGEKFGPSIRISVTPPGATYPDGRPKVCPDIKTTTLRADMTSITKPKDGSVRDITKNCAISPIASVVRGVYISPTGAWGIKLTLDAAYVLLNMAETAAPQVDTSGVTVVEEEEDNDVPAFGEAKSPDSKADQFDDAAADAPSLLEAKAREEMM